MALGTITGSNLISQVWQNVYDIINSNVSDPKTRAKWVYSAFPASRKGTANVFPCIVIESPDLDGTNIILGHSQRSYTWTIPISVYSTKMQDVDTIGDSVLNQLETNKGSLTTYGLHQLNFTSAPTAHVIIANNIVHEKRIEIQVEAMI